MMKKLLSVILAIVMLLQTAAFAVPMAVMTGDTAEKEFGIEEKGNPEIGSLMSGIQHYTSWSQLPLLKTDTYYKYYFDPSVNPYFPYNAPYSPNYPSEYKKDSEGEYVYGNCTWYCWARASEMLVRNGKNPLTKSQLISNPSGWFNCAGGLSYDKKASAVPKTNSIAVYQGHVRYIEYADSNYLIYSESGYRDTNDYDYDMKTTDPFNGGKPTWLCYGVGTATKNSSGKWVSSGNWSSLYGFEVGSGSGDSKLLGYIYLNVDSINDENAPSINTKLISNSSKSSYTIDENVTITWNTYTGASSYGLTISRKTGSSWTSREAVYDKNGLTGNSVNIGKLPVGEYRFNMGAYSSGGSLLGDYSELKYFTVVATSGDEPNEDSTDLYPYSSAYKSSKYYTALNNVEMTGDEATDLVNVALSQVGYHEGNSTSELDGSNASGSNNYSEYGYWFGTQVKGNTTGHFYDWCAMFVSWCARHAGISTNTISNSAYAKAENSTYKFANLSYFSRESGTPQQGDLIFFDNPNVDGPWDHVGIVESVTSTHVKTIEGNAGEQVKTITYNLTDTYIQGYGRPGYKTSGPSNESDTSSTKYSTGTYKPSEWDGLNIRSGASTSYSIIGTIASGTNFVVTQVDGNWGKTTCNGATGWVCLDFATYVNSNTTNPPTGENTKNASGYVEYLNSLVGDYYEIGWCQSFVYNATKNYFGIEATRPCATEAWKAFGKSSSRTDIPLGATVYFGGSNVTCEYCNQKAGHVGIYVGNNEIVHAWTGIQKNTIDWVLNRGYTYRGWGWNGNYEISQPTGEDSSEQEPGTPNEYETIAEGTYVLNCIIQSYRYLTAKTDSNGGQVEAKAFANIDAQKFQIVKSGNGYKIISKNSTTGRAVSGYNDGAGQITGNVTLADSSGSSSQIWLFRKEGDYYVIYPSFNTSLALTSASTGRVVVSTYTGNDDQLWNLTLQNEEPEEYTVTYNPNGGTGAPANQTKVYGTDLALSSDVPERTGYTFLGWSTTQNGSVEYSAGAKYTANSDVTLYAVWQMDAIPVTNISLDKTSVALEIGDTQTLTATITPSNATDKTVTWTSSNPSVASVSNGVITAKAVGTATITVKTTDGSKTATCTVTVKTPTVSVAGISLNKSAATLEIDETVTLLETLTPSNATNKNVTWTSSDNSVATVSNGTVTAVGEGTAIITVRTVDGNKTATCTVTVTKPEAEEPDLNTKAAVTLSSETGRAGDKVSVIVSLETDELINTIGISGITYDKSVLTFDSFTQYDEVKDISVLSSFDKNTMAVAIALAEPQKFSGNLFEINFIINENAVDGKEEIEVSSVIKLDSTELAVKNIAGSVTVVSELLGDINHDDYVDMNDAVLLLQHSLFSDIYPLEYKGSVDFTKDGYVDMNDAVLLLQYSLFPDLYPIG